MGIALAGLTSYQSYLGRLESFRSNPSTRFNISDETNDHETSCLEAEQPRRVRLPSEQVVEMATGLPALADAAGGMITDEERLLAHKPPLDSALVAFLSRLERLNLF